MASVSKDDWKVFIENMDSYNESVKLNNPTEKETTTVKTNDVNAVLTPKEKTRYKNVGDALAQGTLKHLRELKEARRIRKRMNTNAKKKLDNSIKDANTDEEKEDKKQDNSFLKKLLMAIGLFSLIYLSFKDWFDEKLPRAFDKAVEYINKVKDQIVPIIDEIARNIKTVLDKSFVGLTETLQNDEVGKVIADSMDEIANLFDQGFIKMAEKLLQSLKVFEKSEEDYYDESEEARRVKNIENSGANLDSKQLRIKAEHARGEAAKSVATARYGNNTELIQDVTNRINSESGRKMQEEMSQFLKQYGVNSLGELRDKYSENQAYRAILSKYIAGHRGDVDAMDFFHSFGDFSHMVGEVENGGHPVDKNYSAAADKEFNEIAKQFDTFRQKVDAAKLSEDKADEIQKKQLEQQLKDRMTWAYVTDTQDKEEERLTIFSEVINLNKQLNDFMTANDSGYMHYITNTVNTIKSTFDSFIQNFLKLSNINVVVDESDNDIVNGSDESTTYIKTQTQNVENTNNVIIEVSSIDFQMVSELLTEMNRSMINKNIHLKNQLGAVQDANGTITRFLNVLNNQDLMLSQAKPSNNNIIYNQYLPQTKQGLRANEDKQLSTDSAASNRAQTKS